jgi:hypothetical protein
MEKFYLTDYSKKEKQKILKEYSNKKISQRLTL